MKAAAAAPATIDAYLAQVPPRTRRLLQALRKTIRAAAPQATEKISYRMPTFYLEGNLVHFAAFDRHVGFYPGAAGVAEFQGELSSYVWGKGSIQFPLDQPLPLELVRRITEFRVAQNLAKAGGKKGKGKSR